LVSCKLNLVLLSIIFRCFVWQSQYCNSSLTLWWSKLFLMNLFEQSFQKFFPFSQIFFAMCLLFKLRFCLAHEQKIWILIKMDFVRKMFIKFSATYFVLFQESAFFFNVIFFIKLWELLPGTLREGRIEISL